MKNQELSIKHKKTQKLIMIENNQKLEECIMLESKGIYLNEDITKIDPSIMRERRMCRMLLRKKILTKL